MIVKYDALNRFEHPAMTLCNPGSIYQNGTLTNVVGILTDVSDDENVFNFNSTSELNFRVTKLRREDDEDTAHVFKMYKAIQNRRLVFVENIGYFMITNVEDGFDGNSHYKDVKAESIDVEISQKMIPFIEDGTYRFSSDKTNDTKGLLETVVETLPLWTIGYVDKTVAAKYRTFEDVDTSLNCLGFFLENMQDAYECIFLFDIINRTINVYSQDNYVRQTDIHITKEDLINNLEVRESADDLYTAITVCGDEENVTIGAINPLGANTIYNFSYYYSWMTPALSEKVQAWQAAVDAKQTSYYDLNLQYYTLLEQANNYQLELQKYDTQLTMYRRCRDNIVAESGLDVVASYNSVIVNSGGSAIIDEWAAGKKYTAGQIVSYGANNYVVLAAHVAQEGSEPAEGSAYYNYAEITDVLAEIDNLIALCESGHENTQILLDGVNKDIETYKGQIYAIRNALRITTYFTSAELEELNNYIFEGSYTDEYVTITDVMSYSEKFEQMQILYDRAAARLERVSQPTQEFDVDTENFIFVKDFEHWSEQLETGCLINVELDTDDIALLFLSGITINYEDRSLSLTFGNRFNKFDAKALFDDMLGNISKSANTLNYLKEILYPIKSGEFNAMKEAVQTSRDLTMAAALASDNEEVVIDGSGYTGKKLASNGTYDPRQVKITGKSIVFTDDAWETCKVAIGELLLGEGNSIYGVNAQAIIGDIIMGNNLRIVDSNGNDLLSVVDGRIFMQVKAVDDRVTSLEQDAGGISIRVTSLEQRDTEVDHVTTTTGYTFGANGLNIHKSGEEMTNLLDNTGMYVSRSGENVLAANNEGVNAINLTARQYLIIGTNSRIEDYSNGTDTKRTACFYLGG